MVTRVRSRRGPPRCRRARAVLLLAATLPGSTCTVEGSSGPPGPGDDLPAFGAPSLGAGDSIFLSSFRGRPVVVNLWATWCAPCRHETPYLESTYERFRDRGLGMVGITVDGRNAREDALGFIEEMGVTYTQLHDASMVALDLFHVFGLPVTYVADGEGVIRFARYGPVLQGDAEFEGILTELMEGPEAGKAPGHP